MIHNPQNTELEHSIFWNFLAITSNNTRKNKNWKVSYFIRLYNLVNPMLND